MSQVMSGSGSGALCTAMIAALAALGGCGSSGAHPIRTSSAIAAPSTATSATTTLAPANPKPSRPRRRFPRGHPPFAVRERVLTFVDQSRKVRLPSGAQEPRTLVTVIRYPTSMRAAGPLGPLGPFPLIVFGHGFAVTPASYARLLRSLAAAGYVVAAPLFPLGNANAPGGPDESDLVNQPRDMRFVISRMLRASADPAGRARAGPAGSLSRLIDPRRIAVAGQSDGGDTALATAYDPRWLDRRVRAAVIFSGAEIPGIGGFDFPASSPPLLAMQGSADTINPPAFTQAFYDGARAPKFLLTLLGAPHLGPYTDEQPQLAIVERCTIAFLDHYLKRDRSGLQRLRTAGGVPGTAVLAADP
ncbi:MAG: alpha/beta hydrolase family protein [Solirubrobacteraceae bacterium]